MIRTPPISVVLVNSASVFICIYPPFAARNPAISVRLRPRLDSALASREPPGGVDTISRGDLLLCRALRQTSLLVVGRVQTTFQVLSQIAREPDTSICFMLPSVDSVIHDLTGSDNAEGELV